MSRAEVEKVRNESNGYKSAIKYDRKDNPWIGFLRGMAKAKQDRDPPTVQVLRR